MSRGLSKQQLEILEFLRGRVSKELDGAWFSSNEVVSALYPAFGDWLETRYLESMPLGRISVRIQKGPWSRGYGRPYDKQRLSVYRSLRSLENRGLVISDLSGQRRYWAVPGRIAEDWTPIEDRAAREQRVKAWVWGARVRSWDQRKRLCYILGSTPDQEETRRLVEEMRKEASDIFGDECVEGN